MSTQPASPSPARAAASSTRRSRRLWLVVGVVIVVGARRRGSSRAAATTTTSGVQSADGVPIGAPTDPVARRSCARSAAAQPMPVYWAGPQPNRSTRSRRPSSGRYYVRYLTPKARRPATPAPRFLTVGTYPGTNAYGALQVVGRAQGHEGGPDAVRRARRLRQEEADERLLRVPRARTSRSRSTTRARRARAAIRPQRQGPAPALAS